MRRDDSGRMGLGEIVRRVCCGPEELRPIDITRLQDECREAHVAWVTMRDWLLTQPLRIRTRAALAQ